MKNSNSKSQTQNTNVRLNDNKRRPENKDNLDSRGSEEQHTKGDDVTHNHKDEQTKKSGKKANT